jgi:hypothetical protein
MSTQLKHASAEKTLTNLRGSSALTGDGTEMMTSWSGPSGDMIDGGMTEAFTSWSGPAGDRIDGGDAVEAFTSWSGPIIKA